MSRSHKRPTTEEILLQYLSHNRHEIITTPMIESELPHWARSFFGILHTPGTYSRAWRKLREEKRYTLIGVNLIKEVGTGKWEMIRA